MTDDRFNTRAGSYSYKFNSIIGNIFAGIMTFISFIICGIVPLLIYMFVDVHSKSDDTKFYISIGMTAAALFILGAIKVKFLS